jgi:hypothetical protein
MNIFVNGFQIGKQRAKTWQVCCSLVVLRRS